MDNRNEKLLAMEALINQFAVNQFAANGVTSTEAVLIMKSVYAHFSDAFLRDSMRNRIKFNNPDVPEARTGTKEELLEDFKRMGLSAEGEDS